jgi:hypothetical protein
MHSDWPQKIDRRRFGRIAVGGLFAAAIGGCSGGVSPDQPEKVWGSIGAGKGQFSKPRAIAIDEQDQLYIVDMTARIQVFDVDGNYIRGWQMPEHSYGRPTGLTFDTIDGNLLVADTHYNRVLTYTPTGELLTNRTLGGTMGQGPGEFGLVADVVRDATGNYYVSEYGEFDRVQKFTPDGRFILQWGGHGTEPGQFMRPQHLELDVGRRFVQPSHPGVRRSRQARQNVGHARERAGADVLSLLHRPRWQRPRVRVRVRQPPRAEVYTRWKVRRLLGQRRPQAGPTQHAMGASAR